MAALKFCRFGNSVKYSLLGSNSYVANCKRTFPMQYSSSADAHRYDVVIVGGGIVGNATAMELSIRHPQLKLAVLEKEPVVAKHQSGHNSGVIHAGIYYTPGSLKAKLCVDGLKQLYKYCDENDVPYKKVGKLVVAVDQEESDRLDGLFERGLQNEVPGLKLVGPDEIKEIEHNCVGLKAIYSPVTGIIDFGDVTRSYAANFQRRNGTILCNFEVQKFYESSDHPDFPITLENALPNPVVQHVRTKYVITCGGLYADKLAQLSGCTSEPRIVPFRGEYYMLKPEKRDLIKGNIYPVPSPKFPFLGVHFTPRMNGDVWLGPNAVLAFKREGYSFTDVNLRELKESVSYSGTRKLVLRNISAGMGEMYRRTFKMAQVRILKKYVPTLQVSDVIRGPAGVRAQGLTADGKLVDDFIFDSGSGQLGKRMLHVRNAPSPAATSSLPIGQMIADKAKSDFGL